MTLFFFNIKFTNYLYLIVINCSHILSQFKNLPLEQRFELFYIVKVFDGRNYFDLLQKTN